MRALPPFSSNSAQCGQVSEPNSTSFTLALGLPMTKPPSGVLLTMVVQSPLLGAGTAAAVTSAPLALEPAPFSALQAVASKAAEARNRWEIFIRYLLRVMIGMEIGVAGVTAGVPFEPASDEASDSRQARSSGSAIWRRPSPSSLGTGAGALRFGLTAAVDARPCLKLSCATASYPKKR